MHFNKGREERRAAPRLEKEGGGETGLKPLENWARQRLVAEGWQASKANIQVFEAGGGSGFA